MKLNCQEKECVQRKFCAYCIKVLHGEALNYLKELEQKRKREINFSDLSQKNMEMLYCYDDYNIVDHFTVMGQQIQISDEWISEAANSARTAHPFQRNGAPFRFKLSKAQQVN